MGKLTNIFFIGLGACATKYYLDNPKKIKEHKNIIKEKFNNSTKYAKCICNYKDENGVSATCEYLKNDIKKIAEKNLKKLNNSLNCGKQILKDTNNVKNSAISLKDNASELADNIIKTTKVLKEEISPSLNSYINDVKKIVNNITEKSEELKEIIKKENLSDKVKKYKKNMEPIIIQTKEKIDEFSKNEYNKENSDI